MTAVFAKEIFRTMTLGLEEIATSTKRKAQLRGPGLSSNTKDTAKKHSTPGTVTIISCEEAKNRKAAARAALNQSREMYISQPERSKAVQIIGIGLIDSVLDHVNDCPEKGWCK